MNSQFFAKDPQLTNWQVYFLISWVFQPVWSLSPRKIDFLWAVFTIKKDLKISQGLAWHIWDCVMVCVRPLWAFKMWQKPNVSMILFSIVSSRSFKFCMVRNCSYMVTVTLTLFQCHFSWGTLEAIPKIIMTVVSPLLFFHLQVSVSMIKWHTSILVASFWLNKPSAKAQWELWQKNHAGLGSLQLCITD